VGFFKEVLIMQSNNNQKGMFSAKLHTRSQKLNYNSLYSMGTWHAINDTYKKFALNSKEKR
jgi:hypothetical protein